MIKYFIGVYIINRILHGRLEMRSLVKYFSTFEENFVSPRGYVMSSIYSEHSVWLSLSQWASEPVSQWASEPVSQWASEPVSQWASEPVSQWAIRVTICMVIFKYLVHLHCKCTYMYIAVWNECWKLQVVIRHWFTNYWCQTFSQKTLSYCDCYRCSFSWTFFMDEVH